MNPSSDADIRAALEPYAPHFANEHAREQFIRLNPGLAEVSPALLPDLVKTRLQAPEHQHFLKPPPPQYVPGSVEAIEARMMARSPQTPGLGGFGHNAAALNGGQLPDYSSGLRSLAPAAHPAQTGPQTMDQLEQRFNQNQGFLATTGIGLGGQHRAPK
jgi:hypothetical protein